MMRNMVTSLLEHERIVTTTPKAKELRKLADKMITLAKRGDLHARRQALAVVRSMDRNGGYTRIIRTGSRSGDAAPMAIIELVNFTEESEAAIN
jgi:large subunit ribosomal protein L17